MKSLLAAAALVVAATPASAAHWKVDMARSRLAFTVTWSGEPFTAAFKTWTADIDFDPADLRHSRALVAIDLGSETSGEDEFDAGLKGVEGFQTAQFPKATFETVSIRHISGNSYLATGKLTIRGITKMVALGFGLTFTGNEVHMVGGAPVVRTDFGVGQGQWASSDPVAQNVQVTVDLIATRAP